MDANSSKPAETGNSHSVALQLTLEWLDREGGQQRNARILREVAESTLTAIQRGDPPPEKDTATLRDLLQHLDGGSATRPTKPFRATELANWWRSREEQLRQSCRQRGCDWMPRLVVRNGGGRGLTSRLSFEFLEVGQVEEPNETETNGSENKTAVVRYQMDPAKPSLWLRLLVGSQPFPLQSWRGYVLLGSIALNIGLIVLMWLATLATLTSSRPITTDVLALLVLAVVVTAVLCWLSMPIWQLPTRRVTIAGPSFLAINELYGQLRTMPAPGHSVRSRQFSVVRHWGICPICSADVDLDSGRRAFPDRLIGRCHDAPLEHVFSFDPVRLVGESLRSHQSTPAGG